VLAVVDDKSDAIRSELLGETEQYFDFFGKEAFGEQLQRFGQTSKFVFNFSKF
jgi:hypothetical protein